MTARQLQKKIRSLKEQMIDCEEEKEACQRKVEHWEVAMLRVRGNRECLEEFCCQRKNRIRSTCCILPGMSFLSNYQEEHTEFLEGRGFQNAMAGLEEAERNLWKKKDELEYRIEDIRREIRRKEEELEELQRKLRYMEQEESHA